MPFGDKVTRVGEKRGGGGKKGTNPEKKNGVGKKNHKAQSRISRKLIKKPYRDGENKRRNQNCLSGKSLVASE